MDSTVSPDKNKTPTQPRRTRRSRLIGTVIAIVAMAGLGWLSAVADRRQPFAAVTHCLCGMP